MTRKRLRVKSDINVTPFVDVMLVLLVVFMITSSMMVRGVVTDLPKVSASSISIKSKPILIEIDIKGNIYYEKERVDIKQLLKLVSTAYNNNSDASIFIQASKKTDYGKLLATMTAISNSGFKKVSLIAHEKQP